MRISRRLAPIFLAALAVAALVLGQAAADSSRSKMLEFDTMAPVVSPFTGSTNAIRGVPGGGLPWQLTSATGELSTGGKLEIKVEGLVLVATGANPIASFRGVVNCLTTDSPTNGINIVTAPVPATGSGNAQIEAQLELPSPCIAPIVFVTNGTTAAPGAWFAATGAA